MKLRKLNGIVIADDITEISGKALAQIFFNKGFPLILVSNSTKKRESSSTCTNIIVTILRRS